MKRANVSDVARTAGVSTATVSRVLNDPDKVAERTRERVLKAIDKLKFVKSATAFSFKVRQTHNLLVLAGSVGNIYYSEIFAALHHHAEQEGYRITLATPHAGEVSRQITDQLRSGRVDGVIMLDSYDIEPADYEMLTEIHGGTPPIVGFAEKPGILCYPHIFIDNFKAAFTATQHLIAKGHKRIGHISGPKSRPVTEERIGGYKAAMKAAGLEIRDEDIFEAGFHRDHGRNAARIIARRKDRPTAMFCASDEIAMGLMSELSHLGFRTPDDMSVVGFDNIGVADVYIPALTTISQPMQQIGESTFALLRRVMENPLYRVEAVIELEASLADRESVAPPKVQAT